MLEIAKDELLAIIRTFKPGARIMKCKYGSGGWIRLDKETTVEFDDLNDSMCIARVAFYNKDWIYATQDFKSAEELKSWLDQKKNNVK